MREDNELIPVSMNIILHAGDARTCASKAIEYAKNSEFDKANEELNKAEVELNKAHSAQTEVMQNEMGGTNYELCILFIHAQDTLMTIKSEINMAKEFIDLYKKINHEI